MIYFSIFVIVVILFLLYVKFENTNLEVTHYTIKSKKIPNLFSQTTFIVLADLHNNLYAKNNKILIGEINKINPSFIIIAGDMIVGKKTEDFQVALSLLTELASKYTIFYGMGNHEQRMISKGRYYNDRWERYIERLKQLDVHILNNNSAKIIKEDESIIINGLAIDLDYFQKRRFKKMTRDYLEEKLGKLDDKCYNIVIAHNPLFFKEYISFGSDLILSGHMHGGIVRLPILGGVISPQYELFPKYDAGRFEEGEQTMLISRGLGTHTIKLRAFNRPELMVVTLERDRS